jgi:hypothetical protein
MDRDGPRARRSETASGWRERRGTPPSAAVVGRLAAATGVPAAALDPPLYDAVDPDALDRLSRNTRGTLTFGYRGYRVTVDSEGRVAVAERDGSPSGGG